MREDMIARAARLIAHLPGIELSTSYGRPALKVAGKYFGGQSREPDALGLRCPLELKEHLIDARPDLFFETDHYRGWPMVLIRMEAIGDDELQARLEGAWAMRAPKTLRRQMGME